MALWSTVRRRTSWVLLTAGVATVVVSLSVGFTSDPSSGEGWGGGVIGAVVGGGPLLAVGVALRSADRRVARRTGFAAVAAAFVVTVVLVMQSIDKNETAADRAITSMVLVMYLLAAAVELPAFAKWPPRAGRPRR